MAGLFGREAAGMQNVIEVEEDDDIGWFASAKLRMELPPVDMDLLTPQFAQERYDEIVMHGPLFYRDPDMTLPCCRSMPWCSTVFPTLFPQAVCAPCCALGSTISIINLESREDHLARWCLLGPNGATVACYLCPTVVLTGCICSVAAMVLTAAQRRRIIDRFRLAREGRASKLCACVCYPCALWRHAVFFNEMARKLSKLNRYNLNAVPNEDSMEMERE
mmetsp:Transcript_35231/g.85576  ORF Transcript_35231/g.85576 Transcript_35231/m.85576 type:complete len:220 (+) Transcript_35231:26-685(+)